MSAPAETSSSANKRDSGRNGSTGPRVNGGAPGARKSQNGTHKGDFKENGGRRSPSNGAASGQKAKATPVKPKTPSGPSNYLLQRGATAEDIAIVGQIKSALNDYYSEEIVFNTFVANQRNADATRAALVQTKTSSWASKVAPISATAAQPVAEPVPAPAHIAQQQQAPRPRKVKPTQDKKPATPEQAAEAVPSVNPEQLEKSLETALQAHQTEAQELLDLKHKVTALRSTQAELNAEKETLGHKVAELEKELAETRARLTAIDQTQASHNHTLAELHKTIAQKTAKQ